MNYSVVIPAAGQGKRMKLSHNKQFLDLEGKPVIVHTLNTFQQDDWCSEIIVVGNPLEIDRLSEIIKKYSITKVTKVIPGGKERQNSVFNGLKAVQTNTTVLIHDGARPFVSQEKIHQLVIEAEVNGGAVLAVPMKDTVKKAEGRRVLQTVDRSCLWSVQTPQAFKLSVILQAHKRAEDSGYIGTDDASLLERYEGNVSIVEGDYYNIKLTTQEDIVFAKAIIEKKRSEVK